MFSHPGHPGGVLLPGDGNPGGGGGGVVSVYASVHRLGAWVLCVDSYV